MKIAVTGASGFLGRHVLAELTRRGHQATLLLRNPPTALSTAGQNWVQCDHLQDDHTGLYGRAGRPDVLLHLAWGGLPNYRSLHHWEQERPAQYRLLKSLVQEGLPRLVVAGTCFEYGLQSGALAEDLACRPANPYGCAKHTLRQELQYLRRDCDFEWTWARLFYFYGDGQGPTALWSLLQAAVRRGDTRFAMSGGQQLRDYLTVEQVASYLVALTLFPQGQDIINVCAGRPVSVRELVEGWIQHHGWTIRPDLGRLPYPDHEPMAFWGDDSRLRAFMSHAHSTQVLTGNTNR